MEAIFLILKSLFAGPIKAINALFDLLKAQKTALEIFATDKADSAKNIAISEARKAAVTLATQAKDDAVLLAATEAALLANAAKNAAIASAKIDATQKAKSAQETAIDASNFYTDTEIAKLKLQAEAGYTPRFMEGLVSESQAVKGQLDIIFPTLGSLDMSAKGHYTLNITGKDAKGAIIADSEFFANVRNSDNSQVPLMLSTNDVLIFESDGKGSIKFIQKYDNRLMEVVKNLEMLISDKVGKTEFEQAISDTKAYIDAAINPALLA